MHWGPKLVHSLVKAQPQLSNEEALDIFKRKWEYMCVYAEVGFARAYTSCHHFTFARPVRKVDSEDCWLLTTVFRRTLLPAVTKTLSYSPSRLYANDPNAR